MKFCSYCGNFLLERWNYCPYCGKKIKGEPSPFDSLFKNSISGISIRVTSREGKKPKVRVNRFGGRRIPIEEPEEPESKQALHSPPRRVLEPEGETQQVGQHMEIRVRLPGVREEDVDVRRLESSIEIKAYRGDEAYFKQFHVPESARIISKHMEGNELVVEVG